MRKDYKPNFTQGSLLVPESRIIADLLLNGVTKTDWDATIVDQNILQKRTKRTALTYAWLIRRRLETMSPELWELVRDGSKPISTNAVLASTVKYSPLLGDFMQLVLGDQYKKFETHLRHQLWERYIEDCRDRDQAVSRWSDSTLTKLRQSAYRILAEAGYITDTRSLTLRTVHVPGEVLAYLRSREEDYVLRCLRVSQ